MQTNAAPVELRQRIKLVQMGPDPCPIEPGAEGGVTFVSDLTKMDGTWQIGVKWDSGRTLSLVYPVDKFSVPSQAFAEGCA